MVKIWYLLPFVGRDCSRPILREIRRIPFCSMEREVWKSMRMPWQGSHFFPVRLRS